MKCNLKGGSLASNFVGSLLTKRCNVQNSIKTNKTVGSSKNVNLYQTTGGGKRKSRASRNRKSGSRKRKPTRKRKSGKSRRSRKGKTMKGGSDWVSVARSRGPVSYGSTYDKTLFTTFTNTGKFYGSQNELNKRGGGPSPKKRRPSNSSTKRGRLSNSSTKRRRPSKPNSTGNSKNNMKDLTRRVSEMGVHIAGTPSRIANSVEREAVNTALNVTKSAERNMKDLERDLTGVLSQKITKTGTAAKREMRKGRERVNKLKKGKQKK
jgi:hypothetical protein